MIERRTVHAAPVVTRRYRGQRALRVAIRTAHIGAAAMLLGAVSWGHPPGSWAPLVVATGLGLIADDLYRFGASWLRWTQSWVVIAKVAVVVVAGDHAWALWAALILGAAIAHAPGAVRHRPLWGAPGPCAGKR